MLLFINMEHESTESGMPQTHKLPDYARWQTISGLSVINLLNHYRATVLKLS